jgi:cell division initiation protein
MRITPLDIRKQEFRKAMRGLDAEEVYAFLSTIGDEYEAILNDNKALRERLLELDDKVQEYRSMEKTLRDTLLTAERVTVEAKDNARREANLIIKEAQIEAEKALRDINNEAMKLRQEVSQLRSQRESYLGRMKVIAESLLKFIEGVDEDFRSEDEAFADQLPEVEQKTASLLADPPAENVDLFEVADETPAEEDAKKPPPAPETTAASIAPTGETVTEYENRETTATPGVPQEMKSPGVVDSHSSGFTPPREPAAPIPTETAPNNEKAAPQTPREIVDSASNALQTPREIVDSASNAPQTPQASSEETGGASSAGDAAIPDDTKNDTKATLADINAIIERMADGQKEILAEPRGDTIEQHTTERSDSAQFESIPPTPASPTHTGGFGGSVPTPQHTSSAPTEYTPAGDYSGGKGANSRVPVGGAWDRVPEVATAVDVEPEMADPGSQPLMADPVPDVPTGNDVTSEMSLDQIRHDLEKRISAERNDDT